MSTLHQYMDNLISKVASLGLGFSEPVAIPYGLKLVVQRGNAKATINLYSGKKGFSSSVQSASGSLKAECEAFVSDLPGKGASSKLQQPFAAPIDAIYCGSDESGKGDWFGPLVVAGVLSSPDWDEELRDLGVKDSKVLKEDQILRVSQKIIDLGPNRVQAVVLIPAEYNSRYSEFVHSGQNLNHMLGSLHAEVIRRFRGLHPQMNQALVDQFAKTDPIGPFLGDLSGLRILQRPGGEANAAVAAASIVARSLLVDWHEKVSNDLGFSLPYGAGPATFAKARTLLNSLGEQELRHYLKWHFKSTRELLGA